MGNLRMNRSSRGTVLKHYFVSVKPNRPYAQKQGAYSTARWRYSRKTFFYNYLLTRIGGLERRNEGQEIVAEGSASMLLKKGLSRNMCIIDSSAWKQRGQVGLT